MRAIGSVDRTFMFVNLPPLLDVASIPFPTGLVADSLQRDGESTAVIAYTATLLVMAFLQRGQGTNLPSGGDLELCAVKRRCLENAAREVSKLSPSTQWKSSSPLPLLDDPRLKRPYRSRGTAISTSPTSVSTVIERVPLRESPLSRPSGECFA